MTETLLQAILENQVAILLALSRQRDTPIHLGEDLRLRAACTRVLLDQSTKSPRSS